MKINKMLLVSMILLAILTFGAASAAEDTTVDNLTVVDDGGSVDIASSIDEVEVSGDIALDDSSSDNAIDSDVKYVKNTDSKLSASASNDLLGEDYEVITQDEIKMRGWEDRVISGNYKFEGVFNDLPDYLYVDGGTVIDATGAKFIDTGIILVEPDVQINGLTIEVTKHLIDENAYAPDGTVIYVGATDNVKLNGLTVDYAPANDDHDAFAVVIDNAMDFELKNSEITLNGSSLYDNYEYAMKIMGATNGLIEENIIRANLPILDVDYSKNGGKPGLDTDLVLTVGVQESNDIDFIGNTFIAHVIDRNGDYATLDCMMIENSNNINIIGNTFNETDFFTQEGENNYLNVLDMYYTSNVLVQGNKISVETTGGSENAGTSYPIQITGPYENVLIDGNDLYSNCAGPALGIYSQNYYGDTEITVTNNNIDVTGLPTHNSWGLVSGIELQDNVARVYNNTITTKAYNGYYEEGMYLYGISYAQALNDNHQYDIRDNTIITEGDYAIYLLKAADTIITDNSLSSGKYQGDEAIYIEKYDGNLEIRDNYGRNTFYVSESGDDYAEGTEDAPFKNIARALEEIPKTGTIYLLEGTHSLTNQLNLDKSVSFIGEGPDSTVLDMSGFPIWTVDVSLNKISFEGINFKNIPDREAIVFAADIKNIIFENCIFNINTDKEVFILDGRGANFTFKNNAFINEIEIDDVPLITVYNGEYNLKVNNNILNSLSAISNSGSGSVDLDYNYWGTNNFKEIGLRGFDIENIKNIVIANLSVSPSNEIYAGSQANITVDFNNYFDILNEKYGTKNNLIPDAITVQFKADGKLGDEYVDIENGKATTTYDNDVVGTDEVIAIVPYQELSEKITVLEMVEANVKADNTIFGSSTTVYVTIPGQSGTVEIKVNGKTIAAPSLENGEVTQTVDAGDIVVGENNVEVIFGGNSYTTTFNAMELDGVVTNETFFYYFNASNSNRLCDYIPEGTTLDFQGKFIGSSSVSYVMEINKPINIISTTKDVYIDLDTVAQGMTGENPGDRFTVSSGGSGSNISDIYFHNSQIWINGAHNLNLNNFTSYVEDQKIGSGVGVVALRGGSSHINIKNSYFYTKNNGGSSTFVLTNASYINIDHSSIIGEGNVGNLIYMNVYNMDLPDGVYLPQILTMLKNGELELNDHNNFTNCYIQGPDDVTGICILVQNLGSGHDIFENNTFVYGGSELNLGDYGIARNNTFIGGCGLSTGGNSIVSENIVGGTISVGSNAEVYNNTANSVSVSGTNAKVYSNVINGDVSIAKKATGTNFTKNNVTGTVSLVSGTSGNSITFNNVTSTGSYAVSIPTKTTGNTVTDNYLVSASKKGDEAVNNLGGATNVIQNNYPLDIDVILDIENDSIWLGNTNVATITINDATGNVEIKVNGKTIATPELNEGTVVQTISADDIVGGENTVEATYMGVTATKTFYVYGVVTNETYGIYFNRSNSGRLSDFVPEGATLDFQGKFLSSADEPFAMEINKPVNIITSTNDAYIDLNTTAGSLMGENPGNRFTISFNGSGTNMTGIKFHNSQLWLYNTHNVTLDGVSNVIEDKQVGSGVGATSIRANSTNVTVKNGYFYTKNNGGSSSLVLAWADYCNFENNTIEVEGRVGNLIYLTTFNIDVPEGVTANVHNRIVNNTVNRLDGVYDSICWGIVVSGSDNLIENNTVNMQGVGITTQFGTSVSDGNIYKGNVLHNCSLSTLPNAVVYDNYVEGASMTVAAGGEAYNNTVIGGSLNVNDALAHDNNAKLVLNGANASVYGEINDLDIKSNVNISDITVTGTLRFIGSNSILSNATVNKVLFGVDKNNKASNSVLADSTVNGYVTFTYQSNGNTLTGNDLKYVVTVQSNNNIITKNNINSMNEYAVDSTYNLAKGNNISNNYLTTTGGKKANDAVTFKEGKGHIVENNGPDFSVDDVDDMLAGNDANVVVNILPDYKDADVIVKVNGNVINETTASSAFEQVISAGDLIAGENTVEVSVYGITKSITFNVYEIIIDVEDKEVMLGNDNSVTVTIPGAAGDIVIKVNDVEIATPTLIDGSATALIPAENIVNGENTVEVTYDGFTNSTTFNTITNIVTKDNFFDFFTEDGELKEEIPFDELIFKGDFDNLVDLIIIERPLTITGDEAVLNNMAINIFSGDVVLDNMNFTADMALGTLIHAEGDNINLTNLNINYTPEGDYDAVAINLADCVDVNILNNTIFFESHVTSDEQVSVAVQAVNTDNVVMDHNNITTKLPCVYVNEYDEDYYMMGSNNVNPVRLKDCNGLVFTNNNINSTTNDCTASFPTIQSIYIIGCSNSIIDHNNISMIDKMTPSGMDNYMYGINFGHNNNVTFSYNNFEMYTSGGKDAAGTNYAFQGVESDVIIKGNNITSKSYGPNLGIYVASMFGEDSNLLIEDNFINVTGYASPSGTWALVSGIEIQNGNARIYNNTIYTYNVNEYDDASYMYGISYAQWMYGSRAFDIQNNTIYTEGKYTISVIDADYVHATGNTLYAHELAGDDSINPGKCEDVILSENIPAKAEIIIDIEDCFAGHDNNVTITVVNMTGNVTVKVNGKDVAVEQVLVDNEFNYVISASDLVIGENTVEVTFNGADKVMPTTNSTTFNVTKAGSSVTIDPISDVVYGSPVVINFTIVNETDFVTVSVSDVNNPDKQIEFVYAEGTITVNDLPAGDYIVNIHNGESDLFTESEANATFSVIKANSSVTIDPIDDVVYGNPVVINFTIVNQTDFVTVSVIDVNDPDKQIDFEYAEGTITINDLTVGNYTVNIHNGGTDCYNESEASANFSVVQAGSSVTIDPISDVVYGTPVVINFTIVNETDFVTISVIDVNNPDKVIEYVNGETSITVNDLPAGDYIVNIHNGENELYTESQANATFSVIKANSSVTIDPIDDVVYGNPVVITFNIVNETDFVTVSVNDVNDPDKQIEFEYADGTITINDLTVGNYTVNIHNGGTDCYNESEASANFSVVQAGSSVTIDPISDVVYGTPVVINFTIVNETDFVTISVIDVNDPDKVIEYEYAEGNITVNDLPVGNYIVNIHNGESDLYTESQANATFSVLKLATTLTADNLVMAYKDGSDWIVTLTDANGEAISDATVGIGINGKVYNVKTDANGNAGLVINLAPGTHAINATFDETPIYESAFANATITVNKGETTLSASDLVMSYKDGSAWEVTLSDANGNAISGVNIAFGIKGSTYNAKTDDTGVAKLPMNLAPGTYDINATFAGSNKYEQSFANATVTINKAAAVLSAADLVMNYKDGSAWEVTLTDAEGNAISGVNIAIGIKGSTYNVKTDDTGVAKLPINLGIGTYEISAALNNGYYEAESIQANVTVNKATATLTADDLEMCYKDGSAYSVNVVDTNGAVVANAVVKFTIGTSNYNIKTDANGVAKLPITLAIGTYDVTATLNDASYESEAISNTINVTDYEAELVASNISMTYKDGTAYEVQLVDGEGNNIAVANLIVKITIKGSTYNVKTDANGIAKLAINLSAGTYDISAEYNGKEVTNTIVVNKA